MPRTPQSVHKLEIFQHPPVSYQGSLFSFLPLEGVTQIDLSEDPFLAIKQAVLSALGAPCGLVTEGLCFFSELFISLYEQLGLVYLEVKDHFMEHTKAFLQKKELKLELLEFKQPLKEHVVVIGKGRSLHEDVSKLLACQGKVLMVAAYSALSDLAAYGITVDIAFATDPLQKKHGMTNARLLALTPKARSDIAQGFEKVAFIPETHCPFSNFLLSKTPHPPVYGYTVIDLAIKFLLQRGFDSFYLTGVDLEEMDGYYADGTRCGYKPDFKKAKEHLESLKGQCRFFSLKELDLDIIQPHKVQIQTKMVSSYEMIAHFQEGLEALKNVDFHAVGLYEMLCLEQNPFYQVVLEPLYEKLTLLDKDNALDKRSCFQMILNRYQLV